MDTSGEGSSNNRFFFHTHNSFLSGFLPLSNASPFIKLFAKGWHSNKMCEIEQLIKNPRNPKFLYGRSIEQILCRYFDIERLSCDVRINFGIP
jgi:hypothetical protein